MDRDQIKELFIKEYASKTSEHYDEFMKACGDAGVICDLHMSKVVESVSDEVAGDIIEKSDISLLGVGDKGVSEAQMVVAEALLDQYQNILLEGFSEMMNVATKNIKFGEKT